MRLLVPLLLLGACRDRAQPGPPAAPISPARHVAAPAQDRLRWTVPWGAATLGQEPLPAGICDLRCVSVAGQWTARLCAGAQPDLKVVSPDCEWLAALEREPEGGDGIE